LGGSVRRKESDAQDQRRWSGSEEILGQNNGQDRNHKGRNEGLVRRDFGDELLDVVDIPLRGMRALFRVWSFVLVQRALGRVLGSIVRDGDTLGAALHTHEEEQDTKRGDGSQKSHYILDNSERD
jgi:hypothetical protein